MGKGYAGKVNPDWETGSEGKGNLIVARVEPGLFAEPAYRSERFSARQQVG